MSDVAFEVARFHAGDERLFHQLVRAYSPRLLPLLRPYARDTADAHDLLQDVWLRAFTKRHHFRGDGSLLGWLMAIARTTGLAHARKHGRVVEVESSAAAAIAVDADDDTRIDREAQRAQLRAAVAALPDRQRDVVVLRILEGKSITESARLLNCAEGTVKAALHQALRKLQERLA